MENKMKNRPFSLHAKIYMSCYYSKKEKNSYYDSYRYDDKINSVA